MYNSRFCLPLAIVLTGCAACDSNESPIAPAGDADGGGDSVALAPDGQKPPPPVDAGPPEAVHFLGRFDTSDPAGPRFAYPGSAMVATFTGTGISVTLTDNGQNFFDVTIDGATTTLATGGGKKTYPLATALGAGTHQVAVTKRTESFVGIVQFGGFTAQAGALVPTPFPFARRIEMIGDSITCGYGDVGMGPTCGFTPATENENLAWGAIAAQTLGAMHVAVSYSGRGMERNNDGSTQNPMPDVWLRTFADDPTSTWDFKKLTPDAVVINLATNDFAKGDPGQPFADAYLAFVKTIRAKYPSAFIVCALGTMLGGTELTVARGYVQGVVTASGDAKVSYLEMPTQDCAVDGCGCDYHPSTKTQAKMGAALAAHLKTVAGW